MTLSTLGSYLQISNNLTKWENLAASQPEVELQTAYYKANIGNVKTPSDLVNNYRLFSYVMTAYGLGDMTSYGKGLIQKVLEQPERSRLHAEQSANPRLGADIQFRGGWRVHDLVHGDSEWGRQ